jgi:hypothetical protein
VRCGIKACVFPQRERGLCLPHLRELTLVASFIDQANATLTFADPRARIGFRIWQEVFPAKESREAHAARARKYRAKVKRDPGKYYLQCLLHRASWRRWKARRQKRAEQENG